EAAPALRRARREAVSRGASPARGFSSTSGDHASKGSPSRASSSRRYGDPEERINVRRFSILLLIINVKHHHGPWPRNSPAGPGAPHRKAHGLRRDARGRGISAPLGEPRKRRRRAALPGFGPPGPGAPESGVVYN